MHQYKFKKNSERTFSSGLNVAAIIEIWVGNKGKDLANKCRNPKNHFKKW